MSYPSPRFMAAVPRLARLLSEYSVGIREGDKVVIRGSVESLPLVRELYREALERGAYPYVSLQDSVLTEIFYSYASEKQLSYISPITRILYEEYDVHVSILSSGHTRVLSGIPPEKPAIARKARGPLLQKFLQEAAEGKKRWTIAPYPTLALAQEAGMRPLEYEDFVYHALKLHVDDPVEAWRVQSEKQKKLIETLLSKADEIRLVHEETGTDLLVKVGGRTWVSDDGHENMPGGEVFTGPVEDATEGCIRFNMPQIYMGVEVEGVKLCFRNGRVVEYDAIRGRDFLEKMLGLDDGAKILGEYAFGLNYDITRQTKEILFDEKIGGTIHMALGNGYPETGSKNQSALHWDMIIDMRSPKAKVYIDGDLVYENGKFHAW